MQRRKNIGKAILLMLLILMTVALLWWENGQQEVVDKDLFRLDDYSQIDKIKLTSPEDSISLTFKGNRWKVNNRYDADIAMINALFGTLQHVEPKRPVAERLQDSLSQVLDDQGVRVSLYEGAHKVQDLLVGGNTSQTQSYFVGPDNTVFLMVIPGYHTYASWILELDESGWREKRVFGFNWQNFQSLEASYPKKKSSGFLLEMDRDGELLMEGVAEPDTTRLYDFLDYVSYLKLDRFSIENLSDSLDKQVADLHFLVKDIGNRAYNLSLFVPKDTNSDLIGVINDSVYVYFDPKKRERLFREKSYFKK